MATRLATHKDIPRLQEMLEAMGQLRSEEAIREAIDDARRIVVLRETDGVVDGFCFSRSVSAEDAVFGPMHVETENRRDWLRGIIEMAFSMAWVPSVVGRVDDQVLHFRMWPERPQLRDFVRGQFRFRRHRLVRRWRRGDSDGYEVESDGAWHFHIKRSTLIERATELLGQ